MLFYDLNLKCKNGKERDRQLLLKRLYELGWDVICWNHSVIAKSIGKPLKIIDIDAGLLHSCKEISRLRSVYNNKPVSDLSSMRQYTRVTITVDDIVDAQLINITNPALKVFDIVAACPGNQKVLSYLCKSADVDIISFDFTHRIGYSIDKKLLDIAIQRGICFEISCAGMLHNPAIRREILSTTQLVVQYLRGRHIILTSGAEYHSQVRGPIDVTNMASLLGIHKEHALKAISESAALVLKHAASRRLRYMPVELVSSDELAKRYPEINFKDPAHIVESIKIPAVENEEEEDEAEGGGDGIDVVDRDADVDPDDDTRDENDTALIPDDLERQEEGEGKSSLANNSEEESDSFLVFSTASSAIWNKADVTGIATSLSGNTTKKRKSEQKRVVLSSKVSRKLLKSRSR